MSESDFTSYGPSDSWRVRETPTSIVIEPHPFSIVVVGLLAISIPLYALFIWIWAIGKIGLLVLVASLLLMTFVELIFVGYHLSETPAGKWLGVACDRREIELYRHGKTLAFDDCAAWELNEPWRSLLDGIVQVGELYLVTRSQMTGETRYPIVASVNRRQMRNLAKRLATATNIPLQTADTPIDS